MCMPSIICKQDRDMIARSQILALFLMLISVSLSHVPLISILKCYILLMCIVLWALGPSRLLV